MAIRRLKFTHPIFIFFVLMMIGLLIQTARLPKKTLLSEPLLTATVIPASDLPTFHLKTSAGTDFDNTSLKGHWSFVYVGYTTCPEICPKAMGVLKDIESMIQDEAQYVFISADPSTDTAEMVDEYVHVFSPNFQGVLGSYAEVQTLASAFHLYLSNEEDQNAAPVAHSNVMMLVNPLGQLQAFFVTPTNPPGIVADFKRIMADHVS